MRKIFIAAATVAALVPAVLPASSAQADSSASLPISSFYQMVVDSAHGHIFISQGSATQNSILVTDLAGNVVTTIGGQNGVMGIALSPDGSTLYAALSSNDAVTAIDTSKLQQAASYPLASGDSPRDVAVQSGKVWVSYNTGVSGAAAIGDINLTATMPAFETQAAMGGWSSAPDLSADPSNTGVLVAVEAQAAAGTSYDTAVEPATVTAQSAAIGNCENAGDLAVEPGGTDFILACGYPYVHDVYSTAGLTLVGSYPSNIYPDAVALDASGDVAVGGAGPNNGGPYAPDVYIYHHGGTSPLNEFGVNIPYNGVLANRGLAWAPDGSELFAVVSATNVGTTWTLEIVNSPTLTRSALTLTGPSSAFITHTVTLTGNLSVNGGSVAAGTLITITRTQTGSSVKATFSVNTDASGNFKLTDTPPGLGQYTYTAAYAGTSAIAAASATKTVTVTKLQPTLSLSVSHTHVAYDTTVKLTVHLGPTYRSRTVLVYVRDFSGRRTVLLRKTAIGRSGAVTIGYKAPHTALFTATFAGDARYAPKTVARTVVVTADTSQAITGYYGTSGRYRLYHSYDPLIDHGSVRANKHGECVYFEAQEYFQGSWQGVNLFGCFRLGKTSSYTVKLGLSRADQNIPYRIRVDFVPNSGDRSNAGSDSSWEYLKIEP